MVNLKVDPNLLPVKAQYFLWNAGTAPIVPFMPIYARQLGFSSIIVGTIYTVLPISGMLAKPLFGAVADHFQLQKTLFLAFQVLTAISFFVIQFIPEIPSTSLVKLDCDYLTYFKSCNNETDTCPVTRLLTESTNKTVLCEFICEPDEWLMDEICHLWNASAYCKPNHHINLIQFNADIPLTHAMKVGSCLHFRIHNVMIGGSLHVPYCKNLSTAPCTVRCNNAAFNDVLDKSSATNSNIASLYQFWIFFFLMIVSWVSMAVVVSVGDTICFEMLGDKPSHFGQQRVWGAVGWGIFAIVTGLLVDEISSGKQQKDYTVMFYLMLAMLTFDVLVSSKLKANIQHFSMRNTASDGWFLIEQPKMCRKRRQPVSALPFVKLHSQTKLSASIIQDVGKLLSEFRVVIFILWCIAVGLCTGLQWNFLFWHLEDLAVAESCYMLHWIKTIEGLVMGVQCFGGELPFLFLAGGILKRIGHVHAMSMVLFAFGLRFIFYSVLIDPWWCLPIELFQGFTFGVFYVTMTSYASVVAPPGTEATVQGSVGAVFEGVGVSLGSLFGGMLYDKLGGAVTFRIYGIFALVLFFVHVLVQYMVGKRSHSQQARDDKEHESSVVS